MSRTATAGPVAEPDVREPKRPDDGPAAAAEQAEPETAEREDVADETPSPKRENALSDTCWRAGELAKAAADLCDSWSLPEDRDEAQVRAIAHTLAEMLEGAYERASDLEHQAGIVARAEATRPPNREMEQCDRRGVINAVNVELLRRDTDFLRELAVGLRESGEAKAAPAPDGNGVKPEAAESADADDTAKDGTAEELTPEDDPNTTENSVSGIHRDLNEAIHDVGGRLNACVAIINAEARAEDDEEDVDLPGPHVRSIRLMLERVIDQLDDCAAPLVRLDHFHIPKRSGEFPTHIIIRGMVTPFQRPLLGAICETAAQLGLPDLQAVHGLVETYVNERKAAKCSGVGGK